MTIFDWITTLYRFLFVDTCGFRLEENENKKTCAGRVKIYKNRVCLGLIKFLLIR